MSCADTRWNGSLGVETRSEFNGTTLCRLTAQQPDSVHVVEILNLFLHALTVDCEGRLTSGSGDLEFVPASSFRVQPTRWQRTALSIPPATQNLFTTMPHAFPVRSAHFQRIRTGMDRVYVDVQATSAGFTGTIATQAWFDLNCA